MTDLEEIRRSVTVCMFDQYGTDVDIQTGLWDVAVDFLKAKGWKGNPYSFVTWWRRSHFENSMIDALLGREHIFYREIGPMSVAQVIEPGGYSLHEQKVRYLVSRIERLKPFPEVPAALDRLRTKYRLVVLSNGSPDMLEEAKRQHGIVFDVVLSVAIAGAFKPHRATYTKAAEVLGLRMDEVLFVANHEFDVVGAKAAGMRTAFIDRRRRSFARWPHRPDLALPSMTALAEAVG